MQVALLGLLALTWPSPSDLLMGDLRDMSSVLLLVAVQSPWAWGVAEVVPAADWDTAVMARVFNPGGEVAAVADEALDGLSLP